MEGIPVHVKEKARRHVAQTQVFAPVKHAAGPARPRLMPLEHPDAFCLVSVGLEAHMGVLLLHHDGVGDVAVSLWVAKPVMIRILEISFNAYFLLA